MGNLCCAREHSDQFFLQVFSIYTINPLTPDGLYRGRTASLTSKRFILYTYSTNIGTEYFKHRIYSPFFFSSKCSLFHNSNAFGSCIIHILFTGVLKVKKKILRQKVKLHSFNLGCMGPFIQYGSLPVALCRPTLTDVQVTWLLK